MSHVWLTGTEKAQHYQDERWPICTGNTFMMWIWSSENKWYCNYLSFLIYTADKFHLNCNNNDIFFHSLKWQILLSKNLMGGFRQRDCFQAIIHELQPCTFELEFKWGHNRKKRKPSKHWDAEWLVWMSNQDVPLRFKNSSKMEDVSSWAS